MIAEPFVVPGVVHDTTVDRSADDVAATDPGAPGGLHGATAGEGAEAADVPFAFVAVTVKVAGPGSRPVKVHEVVVEVQIRGEVLA